jgi:serine/threonine protein phosphatase PrpC
LRLLRFPLINYNRSRVAFHPPQLLYATGQSVGRQRDHNEDTIFALSSILSGDNVELPFGIFIVADGMGGHENGELASGVASRALADYLMARLFPVLMGISENTMNQGLQEIIENGVLHAQQTVLRRAPGGGTTLTAALVVGEQVTLAHVGDSRVYYIYTDGRIQPMTQDHSLVKRLMELGQLTEAEAATHPQRNVLYRAIGQNETLRPDLNTYLMPRPGYMLLCSDGLWGVLKENEMAKVVNSEPNIQTACQKLVDLANEAGGPDNISVVIIQYLA